LNVILLDGIIGVYTIELSHHDSWKTLWQYLLQHLS